MFFKTTLVANATKNKPDILKLEKKARNIIFYSQKLQIFVFSFAWTLILYSAFRHRFTKKHYIGFIIPKNFIVYSIK